MDHIKSATIRPGALSLLLQTARIAGVAPLSFKTLRDGYSISVSRFQLAYSFFVITAFNVTGLIAIYLNLKNKVLVDFQARSTKLVIVSERMTCILACGMGYMGAIRMKNMINQINILEKIRDKKKYSYNSAKEDIKVMWISSLIFISNFIFSLLEVMIITLRASECDIGVILFAIHNLQYNILILLNLQVVVINFEVNKVLLEVNTKLRNILTLHGNGTDDILMTTLVYFFLSRTYLTKGCCQGAIIAAFCTMNQLTSAKAQAINTEVRSITQCYVSVCDVVTNINNTDGLYIFLVYTCFALFSVFNGYQLILVFNDQNAQHRLTDILLQCFWCIMIIIRITFFVEPFHRVSGQVDDMKVLLTQLMYHMTPLGKQIPVELDIMIKQVILNVPKYSPIGISSLNRSQITLIFNVVITLLVFIVQLQL